MSKWDIPDADKENRPSYFYTTNGRSLGIYGSDIGGDVVLDIRDEHRVNIGICLELDDMPGLAKALSFAYEQAKKAPRHNQ